MRKIILLIITTVLSACGNVDKGIEFKPEGNSTGTATHITYSPNTQSAITYSNCKNLTVIGNNSYYNGSSACVSASNLSIVKLSVNAQFPSNVRYCLVPSNSIMSFPETCFTVNGHIEIVLSTTQFQTITLVSESDLSAYKNYLLYNSTMPDLAYAVLR